MINNEYITIADAARMLKVTKYYVYFLVKGRTRKYGARTTHDPPKFTRVIKTDKKHYTWYLIHIDEVKEYIRSKHNGKRNK